MDAGVVPSAHRIAGGVRSGRGDATARETADEHPKRDGRGCGWWVEYGMGTQSTNRRRVMGGRWWIVDVCRAQPNKRRLDDRVWDVVTQQPVGAVVTERHLDVRYRTGVELHRSLHSGECGTIRDGTRRSSCRSRAGGTAGVRGWATRPCEWNVGTGCAILLGFRPSTPSPEVLMTPRRRALRTSAARVAPAAARVAPAADPTIAARARPVLLAQAPAR